MFPLPFEDLKVTTQTYVAHTNLSIPLQAFYDAVQCAPMKQPANVKKISIAGENLKDGDIIYIQKGAESKGIDRGVKKRQMLNVVSIIIKYDSKVYNVKIPNSGKIQMTGCRGLESVIFILGAIVKILKKNSILVLKDDKKVVVCYSICVMSNVNIEVPFKINRDKMHAFINLKTKHISILEKSVGYVGVNVKILSEIESKEESTIDKLTFTKSGACTVEPATFREYLEQYEEKNKKYKKDMYNSFLIFESGKTIMSGCSSFLNRKDAYETFVKIIQSSREEFALNRYSPESINERALPT
jgi:TATA-box binding protein (TBP) (component of TFIID and TFIIIB)